MNRVTRGEKVLDRLVNEGTVSRCGADWLVAAIDPFHDKQLASLNGWPDLESGNSVVRCIKQSMTIARPSSVPATDNWDCHILQWPWLTSGTATNGFAVSADRSGQTFRFNRDTVSGHAVGGLQAYGMPAGVPLSILETGGCINLGTLNIANNFTSGAGRVVGLGFEVHNTTAAIQQQGACCVYRQMANSRSPSLFIGVDTSATLASYPFTGIPIRFPPANLQEALLTQGSRQWEAREGCYVVAAFNDAENPAYPIQPMAPIIMGSGNDDLEGVITTTPINFPVPGGITSTGFNTLPVPNYRVHPIHQSGAIFSGLSPTTTLTINWNVFYESFPGLSQLDILPLATPSCEYDPDALDLFERILQDLPVGVKVKENGLGDWFLGAISDAAKFVSPLLMASGNPLAMGAGALTKYVGDTAGSYVKTQGTPPSTWETESGGITGPGNANQTRKPKKKQKKPLPPPKKNKQQTRRT